MPRRRAARGGGGAQRNDRTARRLARAAVREQHEHDAEADNDEEVNEGDEDAEDDDEDEQDDEEDNEDDEDDEEEDEESDDDDEEDEEPDESEESEDDEEEEDAASAADADEQTNDLDTTQEADEDTKLEGTPADSVHSLRRRQDCKPILSIVTIATLAVSGVKAAADGTLYATDFDSDVLRKVYPDGHHTVYAGRDEEEIHRTELSWPAGLAINDEGTVFIADSGNCRVVAINEDGRVVIAATFQNPTELCVGPGGELFIANESAVSVLHKGRRTVVPLAGSNTHGYRDGVGVEAQFDKIVGLAADSAGNLFVADGNNCAVRKVAPNGTVTTLVRDEQKLAALAGITMDKFGFVYSCSEARGCVLKISPEGTIQVLLCKSSGYNSADDTDISNLCPIEVTMYPDGSLIVVDCDRKTNRRRILRVKNLYMAATSVPASSIVSDMTALIDTPGLGDVEFVVENKSVFASRAMLACRSSHFKSWLYSGLRETFESRIVVPEVPHAVFRCIVLYLLTDQVDFAVLDPDVTLQLLLRAHQYGIMRLVALCEQRLCAAITPDFVCKLLNETHEHRIPRLSTAAFEYILQNFDQVRAAGGLRYLNHDLLLAITEELPEITPQMKRRRTAGTVPVD